LFLLAVLAGGETAVLVLHVYDLHVDLLALPFEVALFFVVVATLQFFDQLAKLFYFLLFFREEVGVASRHFLQLDAIEIFDG
jgi:hypothetical protein